MSTRLQVLLLIAVIIYFLIILYLMQKGKIQTQYALVWLLSAVVLLLVSVFPQIIYCLSDLVGIELSTNFIFFIAAIFAILILLSLTVIVSKFTERLKRITQTQALLEKRVLNLEEKLKQLDQSHQNG